jgi:hypothetical protein
MKEDLPAPVSPVTVVIPDFSSSSKNLTIAKL